MIGSWFRRVFGLAHGEPEPVDVVDDPFAAPPIVVHRGFEVRRVYGRLVATHPEHPGEAVEARTSQGILDAVAKWQAELERPGQSGQGGQPGQGGHGADVSGGAA